MGLFFIYKAYHKHKRNLWRLCNEWNNHDFMSFDKIEFIVWVTPRNLFSIPFLERDWGKILSNHLQLPFPNYYAPQKVSDLQRRLCVWRTYFHQWTEEPWFGPWHVWKMCCSGKCCCPRQSHPYSDHFWTLVSVLKMEWKLALWWHTSPFREL